MISDDTFFNSSARSVCTTGPALYALRSSQHLSAPRGFSLEQSQRFVRMAIPLLSGQRISPTQEVLTQATLPTSVSTHHPHLPAASQVGCCQGNRLACSMHLKPCLFVPGLDLYTAQYPAGLGGDETRLVFSGSNNDNAAAASLPGKPFTYPYGNLTTSGKCPSGTAISGIFGTVGATFTQLCMTWCGNLA